MNVGVELNKIWNEMRVYWFELVFGNANTLIAFAGIYFAFQVETKGVSAQVLFFFGVMFWYFGVHATDLVALVMQEELEEGTLEQVLTSRSGIFSVMLGFAVLVLAFAAAGAFSGRLEPTVAKVWTATPEGRACLAWGTVFAATVVGGGVILHLLRGAVARLRLPRPLDPWVGALVGGAKGVVVLGLMSYAVLGWYVVRPAPGLVNDLRTSRAARTLVELERRVAPALRLPPHVASRVDLVNGRIELGALP